MVSGFASWCQFYQFYRHPFPDSGICLVHPIAERTRCIAHDQMGIPRSACRWTWQKLLRSATLDLRRCGAAWILRRCLAGCWIFSWGQSCLSFRTLEHFGEIPCSERNSLLWFSRMTWKQDQSLFVRIWATSCRKCPKILICCISVSCVKVVQLANRSTQTAPCFVPMRPWADMPMWWPERWQSCWLSTPCPCTTTEIRCSKRCITSFVWKPTSRKNPYSFKIGSISSQSSLNAGSLLERSSQLQRMMGSDLVTDRRCYVDRRWSKRKAGGHVATQPSSWTLMVF